MLILLLSLAVLLVLGIPIAYAIGLSSLFFFALNHPDLVQILPQRMFAGFNSYTLMALPLFILMGLLMNEAGITARFCLLPQFGGDLKRLLFEPNTPGTHRLIQERITQALGRFEPRIRVEAVRIAADPEDSRAAVATVEYRLVATGVADRLDLTLRFGQ